MLISFNDYQYVDDELIRASRVGEKFIEWSDNRKEIPLDSILSFVSWYWHTHSFGRSMWAYHSISQTMTSTPLPLSLTKPFGFSSFPAEIASALPRSWAEKLFPNLVSYRAHDKVRQVTSNFMST